ncbi:hypothetical protein AVEN_245047-1 [Araneus ventricosus]|uniref:Uncharacterized protein n=1 Tax=Araneus ventricosus TaxID=182803 RepID=A0A4Y2E8Z0_ARAVE|nr:hypothetical protein AVEN_245047-1 [Araneus ventricosus]
MQRLAILEAGGKDHAEKAKVGAFLQSSRGLSQCSSWENAPKLKLPKFELRKFSGDPKEFLTFWSIFSKIHGSDDLTEIDKFQYLYQSMVPEFRATGLISSFKITTKNYFKTIKQLKARFGRFGTNLCWRSSFTCDEGTGKNSPDLAAL